MKKVVCTLLPVLAIALVLGMTSAVAQNPNAPDDVYMVGYYSGALVAGNPDSTVRVVNDGSAGEADLCAAFYLFDSAQELQACCSCPVSADGIISESINRNLLSNVLTADINHAGVVKVLSTATARSGPTECSASAKYAGAVTPGIRGWITHVQAGKTAAAPVLTEVPLTDSNYTTLETGDLELECQYAILLGSGHGVCSCTNEGTAW
jgi:hypothetical protein